MTGMEASAEKLIRKNIYFTESTWKKLREWATQNGLSPSEEVTELILDREYEKQMVVQ